MRPITPLLTGVPRYHLRLSGRLSSPVIASVLYYTKPNPAIVTSTTLDQSKSYIRLPSERYLIYTPFSHSLLLRDRRPNLFTHISTIADFTFYDVVLSLLIQNRICSHLQFVRSKTFIIQTLRTIYGFLSTVLLTVYTLRHHVPSLFPLLS